uniref:GTP-binding protein TrmE N-terminal domain-containing protein n=1 Tax=Rhodosorus marinus TaxID=101924 RepID=A0A7S0BEH3_9RHOD|mmetsp:Transcript_11728/g.16961  ORF Transcript_11728/g.16961 Transcript_11728/m.16961 type:complete len:272 (+) Transcript_11728:133-948(+)
MSTYSDTIYALSSGLGRAGVAVVRVSGVDAGSCLLQLCSLEKLPAARKATLRKVIHPKAREVVDEALVLYFPQPRSFTGEDVAELHVHGSYAVVKSTLEALSAVDLGQGRRIRPAERGEFTRRAFENGRMDLTEVEGLADLIASETTEQRKQALRQMSGHLSQYYETWREQLKSCLAFAEAVMDFGEDVDESALLEILPKATQVVEEMKTHLKDGRRGEIVRSGVKLAILGPPNAGGRKICPERACRKAPSEHCAMQSLHLGYQILYVLGE